MDVEPGALDAGAGREIGQRLKRVHEVGTAIGVAGVVERVHANDDVVGAEDLGPAERERQEDRVSRGHVGRWNVGGRKIAVERDVDVRRQRRSADGPEIDGELLMPGDAERLCDRARRLHLCGVALAVIDRERVQREAVGLGDGRRRVRIQPAAQQHHGWDRNHDITPSPIIPITLHVWRDAR